MEEPSSAGRLFSFRASPVSDGSLLEGRLEALSDGAVAVIIAIVALDLQASGLLANDSRATFLLMFPVRVDDRGPAARRTEPHGRFLTTRAQAIAGRVAYAPIPPPSTQVPSGVRRMPSRRRFLERGFTPPMRVYRIQHLKSPGLHPSLRGSELGSVIKRGLCALILPDTP